MTALIFDVCFTHNIRHSFDSSALPFRAISRQSAAQQIMFNSITSSAAASFGLGPHDFGTYSLRRTKTTRLSPHSQSAGYAAASKAGKDRGHRLLAGSALAGCQVLLLDREDRAGFNLDTSDDTDAPGNIGEFHVVASWRHAGDAQPLIGFNRAILIVLALIGTPIGSAGRRQMKRRNRIAVRFQNLVERLWATPAVAIAVSAKTRIVCNKSRLCVVQSIRQLITTIAPL